MNILFLCVANSARSQMAEGLLKNMLGGEHWVESAGSEPSGKVHPLAVEAMKELNIDISMHTSKNWEELPKEFMNNLDLVITLCAEEVCPTVNVGANKLHWGLPDPASAGANEEERLNAFRRIRDELKSRCQSYFSDATSHAFL